MIILKPEDLLAVDLGPASKRVVAYVAGCADGAFARTDVRDAARTAILSHFISARWPLPPESVIQGLVGTACDGPRPMVHLHVKMAVAAMQIGFDAPLPSLPSA